MRHHPWTIGILLVILFTTLTTTPAWSASNVIQQLLRGDLPLALTYSQENVSHYKALTANLPIGGPLDGDGVLNVLNAGFHLCATAQIQAMMGDSKAAEESISEAEEYAKNWSAFYNSPILVWSDVIEVTEGFQMEKAGNIDPAKKVYAEHPSRYTLSRLAFLFLLESDDNEATHWARETLAVDPKNPTAHVVLAAISEKKGDRSNALRSYENALRYMKTGEERHIFLPVYYAEYPTAKKAIERLTGVSSP